MATGGVGFCSSPPFPTPPGNREGKTMEISEEMKAFLKNVARFHLANNLPENEEGFMKALEGYVKETAETVAKINSTGGKHSPIIKLMFAKALQHAITT